MKSAMDQFMPDTDVRERFETVIKAPANLVMQTAYTIDMQSIWLIRLIIGLRKIFLRGKADPAREPIGLVEETRKLGWGTLVEEADRLLICGAVCQPWNADVVFKSVPADKFLEYKELDQVKIIWSLESHEVEPNVTSLVHEVRAVATDDDSRRKFLKYWRWARFGIVAIRLLLLPAIRRRAERKWAESNASNS